MSIELALGLITLFGTAAIGMPVAYAIIVGVLMYLGLAGQDLAIAGETMVQRLFDGFLLLAVPLFIVSANIMNAGSISDRLLKFCVALVGRFRGGLGHVNVVASLIFSGMSGSAVADAAGIGKLIIGMMVVQPWIRRCNYGGYRNNRTDYPAIDSTGFVCASV